MRVKRRGCSGKLPLKNNAETGFAVEVAAQTGHSGWAVRATIILPQILILP